MKKQEDRPLTLEQSTAAGIRNVGANVTEPASEHGLSARQDVANIDVTRQRVVDLANVFLPDGLNPFVDVFDRVRARREMRELIDEAAIQWQRRTPGQLIEMLFYGDDRTRRKVAEVYGNRAKAAVEPGQWHQPRSTGGRSIASGYLLIGLYVAIGVAAYLLLR